MSPLKFKILYLGKIECARFRLVDGPQFGHTICSPMSAVLIQHPTLGNILYDTGNSPDYVTQYGAELNHIYPITEFISIEDALGKVGLSCQDIDLLILSHLHFDHVGGLCYFVGTQAIRNVIVARDELANACLSVYTQTPGAYVKSLFDVPGVCYRTIQETVCLADNLTLFIQQSHTPGVIGLILQTHQMGNIIFTSDTVYTRENWEQQIQPGGHINKTTDEFFSNLHLLEKLQQKYDATLFFGHDYKQVCFWQERGWIT